MQKRFSSADIEAAKRQTNYSHAIALHLSDNRIIIAAKWFEAQDRSTKPCVFPVSKHVLQQWAGVYISISDVETAAKLLGIKGQYPHFEIADQWHLPDVTELFDLPEVFTQLNYRADFDPTIYAL